MLKDYRFGLETEFILKNKINGQVLWYPHLSFEKLYALLEEIDLQGLPSCHGLDAEPAHRRLMPYVVEGYHLKNEDGTAYGMHPKGLEIRTPICDSIDHCLQVHRELKLRMDKSLNTVGLETLVLSHHPTAHLYVGPQAGRPTHFWKWAMKAMTTYGPDINISSGLKEHDPVFTQTDEFLKKVNYYAPALTALSLNSPFFNGQIGYHDSGDIILSYRTYKRSDVAPAIELHSNEGGRVEFKFFDMVASEYDYRFYFLCCLILMHFKHLSGSAPEIQRIIDLKKVAVDGPNCAWVKERLDLFKREGLPILLRLGVPAEDLKLFVYKIKSQICPADRWIQGTRENSFLLPSASPSDSSHSSCISLVQDKEVFVSNF